MNLPFAIPSATGRLFDVIGLGENSLDYVAVTPVYPQPNTKVRLHQFTTQPGGQIATALVACVRLGWRARYLGCFGDDEAGTLCRDDLMAERVDVSAARRVPAPNRVAVVIVDERSGARTILGHRDPALRLEYLADSDVTAGRVLLVDCEDLPAAIDAATAARRARVPVIADVEQAKPGLDGLLRLTDVLIMSEACPEQLTGVTSAGAALEALERELQGRVLCVTLGEHGSLARCAGRELRTPAPAVTAVDTTGAGDVFRGAFASACLRWPEGTLETVLKYANMAAALSCRGLGARGALPSRDEVERALGM